MVSIKTNINQPIKLNLFGLSFRDLGYKIKLCYNYWWMCTGETM